MQELLKNYTASLSLPNIRWTPPEKMHITVYFLGNVQENTIPILCDALTKCITKHYAFTLIFKQIVLAPPNRKPTMVWAEYYNNEQYQNVFNDIKKAIELIGLCNQNHKNSSDQLIPHITLSRFKKSLIYSNFLFPSLTIANLSVHSLVLVASEAEQDESFYTTMHTFRLKI